MIMCWITMFFTVLAAMNADSPRGLIPLTVAAVSLRITLAFAKHWGAEKGDK